MTHAVRLVHLSLFVLLVPAGARAAGPVGPPPVEVPLHDWAVPSRASGGVVHTLTDVSGMLPFIAVFPCRVADTRVGSGFGGAYGPPVLDAGAIRSFPIGGQCGVPTTAKAVSLNLTVTNTQGDGDLRAFPQGGAAPLVSTLNYRAGQTIANAAIVPLGTTIGGLSLQPDVSGTDVIIDVNGYFTDQQPASAGYLRVATNGDYAIDAYNSSPTCLGACGVSAVAASDSVGASAVYGWEMSTTGKNYGVLGQANGQGGAFPPAASTYSAGVYGRATQGTANVAGVLGEIVSSGSAAAGVLGISSNANAYGAQFYNAGSGTQASLGFLGVGLLTNGSLFASSLSITGSKSFIAPHPEDPSKEIQYICVEAPTADVYFRGTARLVDGAVRIEIPEHFRLTARADSYMTTLTPLGEQFSPLVVSSEGPEGILVRGRGDAAFHYVVYAERDVLRDHAAVRENVDFTPAMLSRGDLLRGMPERVKALLVQNGTLNRDGTYNDTTARRLGWTLPEPHGGTK